MSHTISPTTSILQLLDQVQATISLPTLSEIIPPYDPAAFSKPPRPLNNFLLFRIWVGKTYGKRKVPLASNVWNNLRDKRSHIVAHFNVLSKEAQSAHQDAFPGYRYCPNRPKSDEKGRNARSGKKETRGEMDVVQIMAQQFTNSSPATTSTAAISSPCESFFTATNTLIWTPVQRPSSFSPADLSHCKIDQRNHVDLLPLNTETSYGQCSAQSSALAAFNESNFNIPYQEPSTFQQVPDLPLHCTQLLGPSERMDSLSIDVGASEPEASVPYGFIPGPQVDNTRWYPIDHNQYLIAASTQWSAVNESTEFSACLDYSLHLPRLNVDSPATDNSLSSSESPAPFPNAQLPDAEDMTQSEFDKFLHDFVFV